jgi:hypothetical protein
MRNDVVEQNKAQLRFYAELNDFLPRNRKRQLSVDVSEFPAIRDILAFLAVPVKEIDLILANGISVGIDYRLQAGDRIALYPVFESMDISSLTLLREKPLRRTQFITDQRLGALAHMLRQIGFDVVEGAALRRSQIINASQRENRIILSRDRSTINARGLSHGYLVKSGTPREQLQEVIARFDLFSNIWNNKSNL